MTGVRAVALAMALSACRAASPHKSASTDHPAASSPPLEASTAAIDPAPAEAGAVASTPSFLEEGVERVLKGTLGKRLRVVMRLGRSGQELRGRYFYESKGIDLAIQGALSSDGAVALEEGAAGNRKSGYFAGSIDSEGNFTGTWTDARGKHPQPFRLSSAPPSWTVSTPVPLYKKRVHFSKRPKMKDPSGLLKTCTLDAEYPEIDGALDPMLEAKLNDALRPRAATPDLECDSPETNDVSYDVTLNQAGILSIVFAMEWCCGAHPSHGLEFVNVSAVTGERITLKGLLLPGARPKLVGFLLPAVQVTAHEIEIDKTSDVLEQLTETPAEFDIEPKGLRFSAFNSQPHVIQAAFADGYFVPFARLAPLLREPGPLDALLGD